VGTGGEARIVTRRRWLKRALLGVVAFVLPGPVSTFTGLTFFPHRFLCMPRAYRADGPTPATLGIPYAEVVLTAADGVRSHAWWVPAPRTPAERAPALLWLHSNGGNLQGRLPRLQALHARLDASLLLLDYRGYGRSEGTPSEAGVLADAAAAYAHLVEVRRVPPERLVLYGRSLGGAVAAIQATRAPCAGLILESTCASVPAMAAHRFRLVPRIRELTRTQLDAEQAVRGLDLPLLVLHGTADWIVPFAQGRAVFEAARSTDKRFVRLEGAGHHDSHLQGDRYFEPLARFVTRVTAPR